MKNFTKLKIPKGFHIHHKDGNHQNNAPENLECLSPDEHWKRHFEQGDIVALSGRFVQGASEAGKIGGRNGKGVPRYKNLSKIERSKVYSAVVKKTYDNPNRKTLRGRKISEDHLRKITEAMQGEKNPMFGRKHTDESKDKMSKNRSGITAGEKNHMFGKTHSADTRKKISAKASGRPSHMKGKTNDILRSANRKWFNNGIENIFCKDGEEPNNFIKGRLRLWLKK